MDHQPTILYDHFDVLDLPKELGNFLHVFSTLLDDLLQILPYQTVARNAIAYLIRNMIPVGPARIHVRWCDHDCVVFQ